MRNRFVARLVAASIFGAWLLGMSFAQSQSAEADAIAEIERERFRAIVESDMEVAERLHADDFTLINPFGVVLSREDYLGGVDAGFLVFPSWELKEVEVRVYGDAATLMHRSTIEVVLGGMDLPESELWHIVTYERRAGAWQAVWSLATEVRPMPAPVDASPPHAPKVAAVPRGLFP